MEKGKKIYIYTLLNENKEIFYVGKSSSPKKRLPMHKDTFGEFEMKIIDIVYDKEQWWIQKLINEGCELKNKETMWMSEEHWEIGDCITVKIKPKYSVKNERTGMVYESIAECARKLGEDGCTLRYHLKNNTKKKNELYPHLNLFV